MKRLGMLFVVFAVTLSTTGCLHTYAGGMGPEQRSRSSNQGYVNPYQGWGGKLAGVTLADTKVEIVIPTNQRHRRVERFGSYLRGFMEAALIAKGAEVVSSGGELKVSVEVTDVETLLMVTIRVTDSGNKTLGLITEKVSMPRHRDSYRNISTDEFFINALERATRDAIMAF